MPFVYVCPIPSEIIFQRVPKVPVGFQHMEKEFNLVTKVMHIYSILCIWYFIVAFIRSHQQLVYLPFSVCLIDMMIATLI